MGMKIREKVPIQDAFMFQFEHLMNFHLLPGTRRNRGGMVGWEGLEEDRKFRFGPGSFDIQERHQRGNIRQIFKQGTGVQNRSLELGCAWESSDYCDIFKYMGINEITWEWQKEKSQNHILKFYGGRVATVEEAVVRCGKKIRGPKESSHCRSQISVESC